MSALQDFNFLVILNLLVLILWHVGEPHTTDRRNVLGIIVLILAAIAVVADIVFIVLKFVH